MIRDDISDNLIYLLRDRMGLTSPNALLSILDEKKIHGGTNFIRGAYRCVCFSEAPIGKLAYILAEPSASGIRYKPFGIMVNKKWLYEKGGALLYTNQIQNSNCFVKSNDFDMFVMSQALLISLGNVNGES